jgi:hypothetical protein
MGGSVVRLCFADWHFPSSVVRANRLGMIVGNGTLGDGNGMAYLLSSTAILEPSGILLTLSGFALLAGCPPRSGKNRVTNEVDLESRS